LQDSEKRGTSPLFGESIRDFGMSCVGKDLSKDVALFLPSKLLVSIIFGPFCHMNNCFFIGVVGIFIRIFLVFSIVIIVLDLRR